MSDKCFENIFVTFFYLCLPLFRVCVCILIVVEQNTEFTILSVQLKAVSTRIVLNVPMAQSVPLPPSPWHPPLPAFCLRELTFVSGLFHLA